MFRLILTVGMAVLSVYFFWQFWGAFRHLRWWNLAVAGLLAVLACNRYIARFLGRYGWEDSSDVVRLVGFVWLAMLFWFFVIGLTLNLWNVLVGLMAYVWSPVHAWCLRPRTSFSVTVALVLTAAVWAWFEASHIRIHHVDVSVEHLPPGKDVFRIAQLSDLHIGSPYSRQRLLAATALLRQLQPDMIVSTGDLVDGDFETIGHLAEEFSDIQPTVGKYAVFGNHEFYAGVDASRRFHAAAGFEVLRGEHASPARGLELVGVDDPASRRHGLGPSGADEVPLLKALHEPATVILLKHQPRIVDAAVGRFDIQLSGHTHGGQVSPFSFLTRLFYRYGPGLHDLAEASQLFVSRGTGTWGPPLRLASPPEVVLFTLRKAPVP